jgi:hypothetical protein
VRPGALRGKRAAGGGPQADASGRWSGRAAPSGTPLPTPGSQGDSVSRWLARLGSDRGALPPHHALWEAPAQGKASTAARAVPSAPILPALPAAPLGTPAPCAAPHSACSRTLPAECTTQKTGPTYPRRCSFFGCACPKFGRCVMGASSPVPQPQGSSSGPPPARTSEASRGWRR